MRRSARILRIHRITVARKLRFLANEARMRQEAFLNCLPLLDHFVFDEMETFEHTKCKPLSIPLVVTRDRKILVAEVAKMPAKGPLASISRKKYGYRQDQRPRVIKKMLGSLQCRVTQHPHILSDQNPKYPTWIREHFPNAHHETTKGRRGCVTGQGELKAIQWDPLFALNHTAAMFRANVNRLFRRTWCTTKIPQGLKDHLDLYIDYHNRILTT